MTSNEYEEVTGQIARSIFEQVEGVKSESVAYGKKNRWRGASGYNHQIDVSVRGVQDIWLIECKCWKSKVRPESVLTFAARIWDIRDGQARDVKLHPSLITTRGFQPGAEILARFFGIRLDYVNSLNEFLIRFKQAILAGVTDSFVYSDEATVAVRSANGNPGAPKT